MRIVRDGEKPSALLAACCRLLVMNGGGAMTPTYTGTSQAVMNGAIVRNSNGDGTVFYMPSIGSNMNVGMVTTATGDRVVTGIVGDPHNVVGLSLPLVRQILLDLGIKWYTLWRPDATNH